MLGRLVLILMTSIQALGASSTVIASDRWIEAGRTWWAFQPLDRPEVPVVGNAAGLANPIDSFHQETLESFGVAPSAEADPNTLIRRVTLDLTGLPPTPNEVDAFLAEESPHAYERLVDRLLATPGHGERWGRLWLDLARYADSDGYEHDARRANAWRYRDWVIEALNADMPFDEFLRLQLAADEVAPDEPRHLAALGFLRNGPRVANQVTHATRADELDDIVAATTSTFLGLTIACARCHDHKSDPVPLEDYSRLVAVFSQARFEEIPIATPDDLAIHKAQSLQADDLIIRIRADIRALEGSVRDRVQERRLAGLSPELSQALRTGRIGDLSISQRDELARATEVPADLVEREWSDEERSRIDRLRASLEAAESHRPFPIPQAMAVVEDRRNSVAELVQPGPPRALAGKLTHFADLPPAAATTGRRAALADWMIVESAPLVARVLVNRLWQGHFGRGLVETPSDFGASGIPPSHPELLEWLAAEFVDSGWSQKAIHRLIVTSAAYRQSSRPRPDLEVVDPDGALFGRFVPRRLEAEAIRDAILWCADTLNPTMGGPGVFPPVDPAVINQGDEPRWPLDAVEGPEVWRRSVYLFRLRSLPFPFLESLDLPPSTEHCPRREQTTTPNQALSLLNSPFVLDQAKHFAGRVANEAGSQPSARIALAHHLATGREPSRTLLAAIRAFLDRQTATHEAHDVSEPALAALADLCHVLLCGNAFLYLD